MEGIANELDQIAKRCEKAAAVFDADPIKSTVKALIDSGNEISKSWSGSWLGYHAHVYLDGLRPRRPGEQFDPEWGLVDAFASNRTIGPWREFTYDEVSSEIVHRAGVDPELIEPVAKTCKATFDECRNQLLPILDVLNGEIKTATFDELIVSSKELNNKLSRRGFVDSQSPRGTLGSRDSRAVMQGLGVPHHIGFLAWLMEQTSTGAQCKELGALAIRARKYLSIKYKIVGQKMEAVKSDKTIFIGHGRSPIWRELKDFVTNRLKLVPEEFNNVPVAGRSNKERLLELLDKSSFALLVMTAEDQTEDGTVRARENVVHEVGLFQGRLGFEKAIVLLEEGCNEFSNINGVGQLRFPKGQIKAIFDDIRAVLEREGILPLVG